VPIIAPVTTKRFERLLEAPPLTTTTPEFLSTLMGNAELVRHVAVVGALHHGKTAVMDMLVEQTHDLPAAVRSGKKAMRFTDTRLDEQVGLGGGLLGIVDVARSGLVSHSRLLSSLPLCNIVFHPLAEPHPAMFLEPFPSPLAPRPQRDALHPH
jgi:hypothetical protein